MNRIIFIFFLFLVLSPVKSQEPRLVMGIQGGVSFPLGTYSSNNLTDGSFTTAGGSTGFSFYWDVYKHIGLRAEGSYTLHPVDVVALADAKVLNDQFLSSVVIRSDPYRWITAGIGPEYHFSINSRFSFSVYGLSGLMWGRTPYQLYKPEYYMYGPDYYEITSSHDKRIMFSGGGEVQIRIAGCLRMSLTGEVNYSRMKFGFYGAAGYYEVIKNVLFTNVQAGLVIPLI